MRIDLLGRAIYCTYTFVTQFYTHKAGLGMGTEKHSILGGKVHIYKRENSQVWQCATYLEGKNRRQSTKQKSLKLAKQFAEDWYLTLRGKQQSGNLETSKNFKLAAQTFLSEYTSLTQGRRNPAYVEGHHARVRLHLTPFFGKYGVKEITPALVQEYRIHRLGASPPPAPSTLNHEIVTLRQIMKTALRYGWIEYLPDFSEPFKKSTKITRRAWFSPEDYKRLYTATRERAKAAQGKSWQWAAEQLHDYVLFMANTGLRPDEANNLEYRDVDIVDDEATGETILVIEVRGKRGIGYCKSTAGAVLPFKRLKERDNPYPTDKVFPANHKKAFNKILNELDLKTDRDGQRRTAYSLRHTYICFRLMEGADIYQIAKNCRTSVEMIEKHYASHIQNALDAAAINVRKK